MDSPYVARIGALTVVLVLMTLPLDAAGMLDIGRPQKTAADLKIGSQWPPVSAIDF